MESLKIAFVTHRNCRCMVRQENYSATIIGAKSVMLDFFSGRIICIKTMHHTDVNKTKVQFELIY